VRLTYFLPLCFSASSFMPAWTHALFSASMASSAVWPDEQIFCGEQDVPACFSIFSLSLRRSLIPWRSGTCLPFSTPGLSAIRSSQALSAGKSLISMPAQPAEAIQPPAMAVSISRCLVRFFWKATYSAQCRLWCTCRQQGRGCSSMTGVCQVRRRDAGSRSDNDLRHIRCVPGRSG
jgi:hypothetical protein